jgi:hypothetical protein
MLKLWSLSPSTLYYSTFRIRQTTLLTLIVNVFGGIIQPLNRCMQIIPHGISRFNYKASSYIEGRYSTVTKAENGMRLAVVGEPRLTKICKVLRGTDKHWSQRVNGYNVVHCVSWRNHWAKGLHLSQCWMYARLHNWLDWLASGACCGVPVVARCRGNDPWPSSMARGGQPTPRMTKVNWVVPGMRVNSPKRKTTKD